MIIVDGSLLAHRCHKALDLNTSQGVPSGMEYGFLRSIRSIMKKLKDPNLVICWDSRTNMRKNYCPEYKANRAKDSGLWKRVNIMQKHLPWPQYAVEGYEADDLMYTLSLRAMGPVYLYTNDKDLLQAVHNEVQLVTSHANQLWFWDEAKVLDEYGVSRGDIALLKAILGCKSDNVLGVRNVRKTVLASKIRAGTTLVEKVANIYSSEGWHPGECDRINAFDKIAHNLHLTLLRQAPLQRLPKGANFKEWLQTMEFKSLEGISTTDENQAEF